ncbi:GNAT family N-acetyltransferase [Reichenbachiella versicolor]|uniref:GNAT family N-acetyltransferase n=1 Tax=Reichenbachiella versicolor TaxID=1821036 RepID=UPI000D6E81B0|nr:GNAT family N-acetyltransferase [Reichenbachiella versicolor]
MNIRKASKDDYDQIWEIFHQVIQTGDTYVFNPDTPKSDLQKHWFADYMHTYVYEENGKILGTYIIKPNQIDLGSHIANASYMVHPSGQGMGIGKALCQHSIIEAKKLGFRSMQFNLVISTNTSAVRLWQKYGFKIVGTIPNALQHQKNGLVDAYVMYREL